MHLPRLSTLRRPVADVLARLAGRVDPSADPSRPFVVGNEVEGSGGRWRVTLYEPSGVSRHGYTGNTLSRALVGLALVLQKEARDRRLHAVPLGVDSREIDRALSDPDVRAQ